MNPKISEMISSAHDALQNSYSPYSKFKVGACILTDKGHLYTGVNVENSAYNMGVCAETSAISQMVSSGERNIKSIVVLAGSEELCSPCGGCRQRIYEFSSPDTMVYMCNKDGIIDSKTISELLPIAFNLNPEFGR